MASPKKVGIGEIPFSAGRTVITTTCGLCILLKAGGKSKRDLLTTAGKIELIFCFTAHNELIFCFVGLQ